MVYAMPDSNMEYALKLVLGMFEQGAVSEDEIKENCDLVLDMLAKKQKDLPDRDLLVKEVQSRVVVWQDRSTGLVDPTGHEEWYAAARQNGDRPFWDRYRRYMEQVLLLPPTVISRLDESTDRVLSQLESPTRPGEWDRRGMVVGQVQSGKTGHYTGLVCKAVDAGYKLIVVLAGLHNSLRSQTQLRLDEGLLGTDSQYLYRNDGVAQSRIGVGAMPGEALPKIFSLTTSHETGDFKKTRAKNLPLRVGEMPVLLVVKKHGGILNNLIQWVTQLHGEPVSKDSKALIVRDIPLLVIDDEADNASINTKGTDDDPTVINRRIRELLKAFEKRAYVGYTATPFANIFSSTAADDDYGLDIFPRHFIENLKPPNNYFGPVRVFGLPSSRTSDERDGPLPIFRPVDDHTAWMPDRHKTSWQPPADAFPESLRRAVLSFLLVCAARAQRGQPTSHNSMLVHTTRYKDVQMRVAEQVEDLLTNLRYRLRYGDGDATSIWDELADLWESDFIRTTEAWPGNADPVPWEELQPFIRPAVEKVVVRTINGASADALEYYENRKTGLSVIAIGGNKLSRGLTLEGLSISYYLRASRMYDTLMQMGRWFGYRPGYEDLCRLYTTSDLRDWYREITAASEELREDFDDMVAMKCTPEDYGLRVRQSPAGLSVTAPTKMRRATTVSLTFDCDISESVTFSTAEGVLRDNWANLQSFIRRLRDQIGEPVQKGAGNYVWTDVPGGMVADEFFQNYRADRKARRARPELIRRYIMDGLDVGELTNWTVALINNRQAPDTPVNIGGLEVGLTTRSPLDKEDLAQGRYRIRRVLSPSDESIDLTREQQERGLREMANMFQVTSTDTKSIDSRVLTGKALRRQRSPKNALLLLYPLTLGPKYEKLPEPPVGFVASFPKTKRIEARVYKVNDIWTLLAFDDLEDDPDDQ
jgi:hypothetical protein